MNYEYAWKMYKLAVANAIIRARGESTTLNIILKEMNRTEELLTHRELDTLTFNIIEAELSISEEIAKGLYSK